MNYTHPGMKNVRSSSFSFLKCCWLLLFLGIGLGMTYLWIYSQVVDASCNLETLERKLDHLRARSSALRIQLAKLHTPAMIKSRLKEQQIDLVIPRPEQIVRVYQEATSPLKKVRSQPQPRDIVILSITR